jgi:hypothetical protein
VLTLALTRGIEHAGTHGVSELERSRPIQWQGQWRRVEAVADTLRHTPPASFRLLRVRCRHGATKAFWAFTTGVRLKRDGRTRLVMVPASEVRRDRPRFLLTEARHWQRGSVIETWRYRWTSDILQEFAKQVCGLQTAQVRQEAAVKRHFRWSGVAPSRLQQAPASGAAPARLMFAQGAATSGQQVRTIAREAWQSLLKLVEQLLAQGHSCEHILEVLRPV